MEKIPMDCTGEAPKEWSENPEDDSIEKDDDKNESDIDCETFYEKGNGSHEEEMQTKLQAVSYVHINDQFDDHYFFLYYQTITQ